MALPSKLHISGIAYRKQVKGVPHPVIFQSGNILGRSQVISSFLFVLLCNVYASILSIHLSSVSEVPTNIPTPHVADIFVIIGFIGGSILTFMLATRLIPAVNIWEQKEMLLYKAEVQFHRTKVMVMGKPR